MRVLLTVLLPILLPTAAYLFWLSRERRRAEAAGHPEAAPKLGDAPWGWLVGSGVALMAVLLGATFLIDQGTGPRERYVPPAEVDGQIVPGQFGD